MHYSFRKFTRTKFWKFVSVQYLNELADNKIDVDVYNFLKMIIRVIHIQIHVFVY